MSEEIDLNQDYRAFYDSTYIRAWDLPPGKNITVTIERVERVTVKGNDNSESLRPLVFFRGKKKGLVLNKGMGKTIKGMYGKKPSGWLGKRIAIYATTCTAFGETHDVVRIRPTIPPAERKRGAPELPPGAVPDAEFEETPETQPQEAVT